MTLRTELVKWWRNTGTAPVDVVGVAEELLQCLPGLEAVHSHLVEHVGVSANAPRQDHDTDRHVETGGE